MNPVWRRAAWLVLMTGQRAVAQQPPTVTELQRVAGEMAFAARSFDAGTRENTRVSSTTMTRIAAAAKDADRLESAVLDWAGTLSPVAYREWDGCIGGVNGVGQAGLLIIGLRFDPFGGGTLAPQGSYPDFARDASAGARELSQFASCLGEAISEQARILQQERQDSIAAGVAQSRALARQRADSIEAAREQRQTDIAKQRQYVDSVNEARRERAREELQERARTREEDGRQAADAQSQVASGVAQFAQLAQENSDGYRGASWHTSMSLGVDAFDVPVFQGVSAAGQKSSEAGEALALGAGAELGLWPLLSEWFGFGVVGGGGLGIAPSADSTSIGMGTHYSVAARSFIGLPWVAAVGEASILGRDISVSTDAASLGADFQSSGSASFSAKRFGAGIRLGTPQGANLELMRFLEVPSYRPYPIAGGNNLSALDSTAVVYRARLNIGIIGVEGEFAPRYPVASKPEFPLTSGSTNYGTMFSIRILASFRAFGDPYFPPEIRRPALP